MSDEMSIMCCLSLFLFLWCGSRLSALVFPLNLLTSSPNPPPPALSLLLVPPAAPLGKFFQAAIRAPFGIN